MSNTGGMEELLLLTCPVPGAGLQGPPRQLQTVVCSSPYGLYKNPLDHRQDQSQYGPEVWTLKPPAGQKKRSRAVWRGLGVLFI